MLAPTPQLLIPLPITRRNHRIVDPRRGVFHHSQHLDSLVTVQTIPHFRDDLVERGPGVLHGHLRDDLGGWGRGEGGEDEGPGVDDLGAGGVDHFDCLAGEEGSRDAVAGGDGCWCHFWE